MYDVKAIYEPKNVKDACELLIAHPKAKIIAGGSDVLIKIREGQEKIDELVSIYMLNELRGVCFDKDKNIRIGSLSSFSFIEKNEIINENIKVLAEAVGEVGSPQIRAIGTIGGNTCNGITSADSASTLLAYDAIVEITSVSGIRYVPLKDFYIKAKVVDLKIGEIQTAIIIEKKSYEGYKGNYIKYAMRNALDIATNGCSVNCKLSSDKKIFDDVRIAYGVVAPIPMRVKSAEDFIRGKEVSINNIEEFSKKVLVDINPRDSFRATKDFRKHLAVESAKRALIESVKLQGGEL